MHGWRKGSRGNYSSLDLADLYRERVRSILNSDLSLVIASRSVLARGCDLG